MSDVSPIGLRQTKDGQTEWRRSNAPICCADLWQIFKNFLCSLATSVISRYGVLTFSNYTHCSCLTPLWLNWFATLDNMWRKKSTLCILVDITLALHEKEQLTVLHATGSIQWQQQGRRQLLTRNERIRGKIRMTAIFHCGGVKKAMLNPYR